MNDIQFTLNGKAVSYAGSAADRLLDVLRDTFRCTSVKCGCKEGECGACSIIKNGKLVTPCIIPVGSIQGAELLTIEGIRDTEKGKCIIEAYAEGGAVQGNKASMGGGIYMNASGAAVARGSALYNNKAAYGGDDLFAFGDRKLTGDGKEITGWYYDGYKENGRTTRWSEEKDGVAYYDKYDAETGTANYALKAAHGLMCTVTYTDGVENEEIFADKVCVVEQDSATPAFDGNPTRSGYTFMGWSPAVTETVTADVTYTAQWKRIYRPTPSTPTVEIPDDDALGLNPGDWFYLAMQEATNSHDYERNAKWAAADEQWTALEQ